jgi:hypothetical protein
MYCGLRPAKLVVAINSPADWGDKTAELEANGLRLVASVKREVIELGDRCLLHLRCVLHAYRLHAYVCRTGEPEADCLRNACPSLGFCLL